MGKLGALGVWTTVRRARLDELASKITSGEGTSTQSGMLYVALAAEFQGYCRDLHQECVDDLLDQMSVLPYRLRMLIGATLETGRALDRQNATVATVARDFKELGISPWESIQLRNKEKYRDWRTTLDTVISARNAIAHSDEDRVGKLVLDGVLTVDSWKKCLHALEELVLALHSATAAHLTDIAFNSVGERSDEHDQ